jgi:hypothetical protein
VGGASGVDGSPVSVDGESVGGSLGESLTGGDESLVDDDGGGVEVSVDVVGEGVGLVDGGVGVALGEVGPALLPAIVVDDDVVPRVVRRPAEELRAMVALADVLEAAGPVVDAPEVDGLVADAPVGAATTLVPKSEELLDLPVGVAVAG